MAESDLPDRLEELFERGFEVHITRREFYRMRLANLVELVLVAGPRKGMALWRRPIGREGS